MRYGPILLLCLFFYANRAQAQETRTYQVSVAGISIGEMKAHKNHQGEETRYRIESEVSFWFFGRISVDYFINTRYKGEHLVHSESATSSNRGDFASSIVWQGDHYDITATSYKYEKDTVINHLMDFSSAKFYFEEPTEVNIFMAENFGMPSPVRKLKDYYEVNVNGNKNRFYYKNGKLDYAVMESPIKNYVIKYTGD